MKEKRSNKLPNLKLQLKVILAFFITALICMTIQFLIVNAGILELIMANSIMELDREAFKIGLNTYLICVGFLIPLSMATGLIVTFRIAGPIRRFELHLKSIIAGKNPGPCSIRKGDEFQELCLLINEAVDALKANRAESSLQMEHIISEISETEAPPPS